MADILTRSCLQKQVPVAVNKIYSFNKHESSTWTPYDLPGSEPAASLETSVLSQLLVTRMAALKVRGTYETTV